MGWGFWRSGLRLLEMWRRANRVLVKNRRLRVMLSTDKMKLMPHNINPERSEDEHSS